MSYLYLLVAAVALGAPGVVTDADLKPISLGAKDARARSLMARGKWKEAAAAVTARTAEARLVRGWLYEKAKQHGQAVAVLDGLERKLPTLAATIRQTRADALLALERFADAAGVAAIPADGLAGRLARRVRARALRELGRYDEARAVYREMVGSGLPAETPVGLLGLARLEIDARHPERAIPLLRRLDVEFPAHWAAGPGRRLALATIGARPSLAPVWLDRSPEEAVARAERLLKRHRNKEVVAALQPLTGAALTPDLRCRQRYALGRALRKLRRWKEARPRLEEAVEVCGEVGSDLEPWARHLAGAAAERLSDEKEAAAHYAAQMKRHPTHRLADDAGYNLVRHLVEDEKDLNKAMRAAADLARAAPEGDMVPDALFFVATHALLDKKPMVARAMLSAEAKLPPRRFDHRDGGRLLYWTARLDQKAGRRADAVKGYQRVLSEARLGWYSLLAYSRLREIDRKLGRDSAKAALATHPEAPPLPGASAREWRLTLPPDLDGEAWERARLLARLGLAGEAWSALKEAGAGRGREDLLWASALLLDRAGAWNLSHDILRRQLPQFRRYAPAGPYRKHWELAYPRPFLDLARKYGKANKVDPSFVLGVIREESGFNTNIESFANAVGLMQLIVGTGKQMAKKADGTITRAALADPDLNVRLGTRYLAYVRTRSKAVDPLLPAGYNAGAGALRRWVADRGDLPLDLFVELIPYDEARGYTKRVAASWATYRALYDKPGRDPLPYLSQRVRR